MAVTERTFVVRHVMLCVGYLWVVISDIKCCLWVKKHEQKHWGYSRQI